MISNMKTTMKMLHFELYATLQKPIFSGHPGVRTFGVRSCAACSAVPSTVRRNGSAPTGRPSRLTVQPRARAAVVLQLYNNLFHAAEMLGCILCEFIIFIGFS
jgi:hypothetical protein